MERVRVVLKDLVLVSTCPFEQNDLHGKKGMIESCGKSAPPLQSVKTKYLAVSRVKDNSERQDIEAV
jgi:hypothetical protein